MLIRTTLLLYFVFFLSDLVRCMESEICFPVSLDTHNHDRRNFDNDVDANHGKHIIKIQAFEQEFVIDLHQDSNFIAPSISNHDLFWLSDTDVTSDLSRCFYSGYVNSDRYSYAALSLCKGFQGAFGFRGWEYFISPMQNDTRGAESAHILRRRTSDPTVNSTSRCAVDSDVSVQVLQSLEKYRLLKDHSNVTATMLKRLGRAKRFASVPRYVETLVVADESMAQFHGDDLKHYLLTLMSVAARLYKHPSILNSISIAVVKIVMITEEDKGPKVSGNAAMTLRNFCTWQKKLNKNSDKHPEYWDTAILFTRQVRGLFTLPAVMLQDRGERIDLWSHSGELWVDKTGRRFMLQCSMARFTSVTPAVAVDCLTLLCWTWIAATLVSSQLWHWGRVTKKINYPQQRNSLSDSLLLLRGKVYRLGSHLRVLHSQIFGRWHGVRDEVITHIHWSVRS